MTGFKNTTRMIQGHHNWDGRNVATPPKNPTFGTGGTLNRMARGGPVDRIDGMGPQDKGGVKDFKPYGEDHGLVRRQVPATEELKDAGGTSPLKSGYAKGGKSKTHFHVHKHYHAKGGRTHSVSHSYSTAEKHAETFAEGGHVHDCTQIPAGGTDYKRGGKTKPVRKNAGGALYGRGGATSKLAMGGVPLGGTPAVGALGRMALRPQGLPARTGPAMRRPVAMPGPAPVAAPVARAKGGSMRQIAHQEVAKHVNYPAPKGHKGLGKRLK
jgi:hypothetical protein